MGTIASCILGVAWRRENKDREQLAGEAKTLMFLDFVNDFHHAGSVQLGPVYNTKKQISAQASAQCKSTASNTDFNMPSKKEGHNVRYAALPVPHYDVD